MSTLKRFAISTVAIAAVVLAGDGAPEASDWDVDISLSKQQYILHERVWLDVSLINNSSDTLRTHGLVTPDHRGFAIDVRDSSGEPIEYTGPMYTIAGGPGHLLLGAGEQDIASFNLPALFGKYDVGSGYNVLY